MCGVPLKLIIPLFLTNNILSSLFHDKYHSSQCIHKDNYLWTSFWCMNHMCIMMKSHCNIICQVVYNHGGKIIGVVSKSLSKGSSKMRPIHVLNHRHWHKARMCKLFMRGICARGTHVDWVRDSMFVWCETKTCTISPICMQLCILDD